MASSSTQFPGNVSWFCWLSMLSSLEVINKLNVELIWDHSLNSTNLQVMLLSQFQSSQRPVYRRIDKTNEN